METMYIVAFNSTHNAIKTEKLLQKDDIKATTCLLYTSDAADDAFRV